MKDVELQAVAQLRERIRRHHKDLQGFGSSGIGQSRTGGNVSDYRAEWGGVILTPTACEERPAQTTAEQPRSELLDLLT